MGVENVDAVHKMIQRIMLFSGNARIMEICGTHTHQIARYGIRSLLPKGIRLVSGPGCPVCVTEAGYIDTAITILDDPDVKIMSFGDLIRVPGSRSSLQEQKAMGKDISVVYSPEDAFRAAAEHPDKQTVFLAVGFETTAPLFAALVKQADKMNINNLFFLTALKQMEPVLHHMLGTLELKVDGLICPGHVAAITGQNPFQIISDKYGVPAAICGFEALDIFAGIHELIQQISDKEAVRTANLYKRCVREDGNTMAKSLIDDVFAPADVVWRGIGMVPDSAYVINKRYKRFDALERFGIRIPDSGRPNTCLCGDILLGKTEPGGCPAFGRTCTPENPAGPCMVSSEGACSAWYKEMGEERCLQESN
ncbi:MAG TPA: hydrogenase formation protein HypD [Clostridiales bacterium]|nr:hydrogenase formation protein HypD [Clostridiales bacterium]